MIKTKKISKFYDIYKNVFLCKEISTLHLTTILRIFFQINHPDFCQQRGWTQSLPTLFSNITRVFPKFSYSNTQRMDFRMVKWLRPVEIWDVVHKNYDYTMQCWTRPLVWVIYRFSMKTWMGQGKTFHWTGP